MIIREPAPAKVNLTLKVSGRRADGYHELQSLVAFASVADEVCVHHDEAPGVAVAGPFAREIHGTNILARALELLDAAAPGLNVGAVRLEKRLPVAAGLGGGSANAAALLRAVRRLDLERARDLDWEAIAAKLGADVPVCLASRATWMCGIGHELIALQGPLPHLDVLLVNPLCSVPPDKTARVFRALGAPPLDGTSPSPLPRFATREELLGLIREEGNDLARAAAVVVPEMHAVLAALGALDAVEITAVSGAGPTCFGVFPDAEAAHLAESVLRAAQPDWWVATASLA